MSIYSGVSRQSVEQTLAEHAGRQFSDFKSRLSDLLISELEPIRKEFIRLKTDQVFLDQCLREGPAARASPGALPGNEAARPSAQRHHLQRIDQCL